MTNWNFLTNHGRALLCIAENPDVRIRDIATSIGITERRAHGIVTDLTDAGYLIKSKEGRRNRYEIQSHLPVPEPTARERAIGEVLDLLGGRPHQGEERPAGGRQKS
ncbi:MAG: winged helix-turn-helix transcriptional regulator [Acidimicrobiales bacterium]